MAILVVAMGVMTVFALFPQALDAGRRVTEAGEVAWFGQYVMASIERDVCFEYDPTTNNWEFGIDTELNMTHALKGALQNTQVKIDLHDADDPGYFPWIPDWYGDFGEFWAVTQYAVSAFTYTLTIDDTPDAETKYARLEIWPGDRREQVRQGGFRRGTVFYREFIAPK